jgi:hypothetical protein
MRQQTSRRVFSLDDARQLLPDVKRLTAEAVRRADAIAARLHEMGDSDPRRDALVEELRATINGWSAELRTLHVEAKGLWLADFDNGEGYYCWSYPEETIGHFHGYEDGFAGRMKIV